MPGWSGPAAALLVSGGLGELDGEVFGLLDEAGDGVALVGLVAGEIEAHVVDGLAEARHQHLAREAGDAPRVHRDGLRIAAVARDLALHVAGDLLVDRLALL